MTWKAIPIPRTRAAAIQTMSNPETPVTEMDLPSDPGKSPEPSITTDRPEEFGGREGPDPVRFGDWEKNGRCIDF
ncbi:MAG: DUF1674 domain-containing protein [Dokdonella sp.]